MKIKDVKPGMYVRTFRWTSARHNDKRIGIPPDYLVFIVKVKQLYEHGEHTIKIDGLIVNPDNIVEYLEFEKYNERDWNLKFAKARLLKNNKHRG